MDFSAFLQRFCKLDLPWYVAELRGFAPTAKLKFESESPHFLLYFLDGIPLFAYKEGAAIEFYELPIDELDAESLTEAPETALDAELLHFHERHARRIEQLAPFWGAPDYRGDLESSDFPDVDEEILAIAIWRRDDFRAELQLRHEDEDLPLLISLSLYPR